MRRPDPDAHPEIAAVVADRQFASGQAQGRHDDNVPAGWDEKLYLASPDVAAWSPAGNSTRDMSIT